MSRAPSAAIQPDDTDISILEILQSDGRITVSELGRRIGLSQPATSERLQRLEERGIVRGYGARLGMADLGLGVTAVIRLRTTHEYIRPCLDLFAEIPNVLEVMRLTGEDCFLLKVAVPDPGRLEEVVDRIARYGSVTTSLVLREEPVKPIGRALLRQRPR